MRSFLARPGLGLVRSDDGRTDRQTDRQTDGDRQTEADRQTDRQTDKCFIDYSCCSIRIKRQSVIMYVHNIIQIYKV